MLMSKSGIDLVKTGYNWFSLDILADNSSLDLLVVAIRVMANLSNCSFRASLLSVTSLLLGCLLLDTR